MSAGYRVERSERKQDSPSLSLFSFASLTMQLLHWLPDCNYVGANGRPSFHCQLIGQRAAGLLIVISNCTLLAPNRIVRLPSPSLSPLQVQFLDKCAINYNGNIHAIWMNSGDATQNWLCQLTRWHIVFVQPVDDFVVAAAEITRHAKQ